MTRLFLAAGVAALAIASPAAAGPHGGGGGPHGGGGGPHGGGGPPHGGGNPHMGGGPGGGGGGQHARPQQMQRMQVRAERQQQPRMQAQRQQMQRQQMHAERQQMQRHQMQAQRQQMQRHEMQVQQAQNRHAQQQQMRVQRQQMHAEQAQQIRANRIQQAQNRQQMRMNQRVQQANNRALQMQSAQVARGQGYGVGGCPPGLRDKGCMPPGLARRDQMAALRRADEQAFAASRIQMLTPQTRILAPNQALGYVGSPLSVLGNAVPLAALPQSVNYLYPDTPDYYYRYGDGYVYQVDRGSNLISSLLPLLGGGYLPGTYLPQSYMSSYVPDYYGLNSFYPANYSSYGANNGYYGNTCNRYADGVVYQVDCGTGLVQNIVPTYASGYGVGQMLPASYNYYNVPTQYRSLYYPTADQSYWYAPGAIYQTDPSSNLITSVAALLSPGFTVGQQLPAGYGMYNVPMAYRSTYYDTPDAWYRYNNGNIYQIDPTTQLVTAVVASLLS